MMQFDSVMEVKIEGFETTLAYYDSIYNWLVSNQDVQLTLANY